MTKLWPIGALVVNAFVWGVSWWPLRELQSAGLHPLWSTVIMYCFALLVVLSVKPLAWRGLVQHPELWLLLLASGLTNVGFNWAVSISDVVRVLILFYLMPGWAVLLAWLLLKERPTRAALLRLLLGLAGVMVILFPASASQSGAVVAFSLDLSFADGLALMGGFSFALTNVLLKRLGNTPSEARMFAMFGGGALLAVVAGAAGMTQGWVTALPPVSSYWAWIAAGLALAFLVSNTALQYGAARLPSSTTSLVMLTEILFGSLSSVAMGAAVLDSRTLIGGALIVTAAVLAVFDHN
ncbi:MAG: DMT family transporter [Burkholderiaceae bacterium]|nr:DMT family transporter [Burkholderiaceae bacterium]